MTYQDWLGELNRMRDQVEAAGFVTTIRPETNKIGVVRVKDQVWLVEPTHDTSESALKEAVKKLG